MLLQGVGDRGDPPDGLDQPPEVLPEAGVGQLPVRRVYPGETGLSSLGVSSG